MMLGGAQNLVASVAARQSRETLDSGADNFFCAHTEPVHLTRRKAFPWPGAFFHHESYHGNMMDDDVLDLNLLSGQGL
jgi:hypothetical protein